MMHSKRSRSNPLFLKIFVTAFFAVLILSPRRTFAQQTFEDGEGAVELTPSGENPVQTIPSSSSVQQSAPTGTPRVGRKAAEKYMTKNNAGGATQGSSARDVAKDAHYLAIHFGLFVADTAFKWGENSKTEHPGNYDLGLTYKLGEWENSTDLAFRIDYSEYSLQEGTAAKLSFLPVISFPDANSHFPLYFGVGAGLGLFLHQIHDASPLSLDYQLLAGLRFFNLSGNTGLFIEAGMKNHVMILTQGQYNGTFVAAGAIFTF